MKRTGIKSTLLLLIPAIIISVSPETSAENASLFSEISPRNPIVPLYDPFIVEIKVEAAFSDPHDPDEVELNAYIRDPEAKEIAMSGFFTGKDGIWEMRYTPVKEGKYSYYLGLKGPGNSFHKSDTYSFEARSSSNDGFLRKSKNNYRYLVFDSGKPFFGLGHNVAWTPDNNASTFKHYFEKLAKNNCNTTRIWLNNAWTLKIEFEKLGSFNMSDSEELDRILETARKSGIYVVLTLDSYSSLMDEKGNWGEGSWERNVYNSKMGGPCERPFDFFTNPEAKRLYKKRLRYIVSRWGYSSNILAFELWNEIDAPEEWTAEMARCIKSLNPHNQLVTTSVGYPWANNFDESKIWSLEEIDIVTRHIYGNMAADITGYIVSTNRALSEKYRKPILIEEFGMDWGKSDTQCDIEGTGAALHTSIWGSALSGSFGGTMGWWWDSYMVKHEGLYSTYTGLYNFIKDVDWDSPKAAFAKTTPLMRKMPENIQPSYSDVSFSGKEVWGEKSYTEFTVEENGELSGGALNHYLHGTSKKDIRIEPIFHVNYPIDGELLIYVGLVSDEANLVVTMDGQEALSKKFLTGEGEGPWQSSFCRKEKDKNVYQCYYGTTEKVSVPKGAHTIKISNTGRDWLGLKRVVFTNYKPGNAADAGIAGLIVDGGMLFWIHNKAYDWRAAAQGKKDIIPIEDSYFSILDTENGEYGIQWWDTFEGRIVSYKKAKAVDGKLTIEIPPFSKDTACKVKKLK